MVSQAMTETIEFLRATAGSPSAELSPAEVLRLTRERAELLPSLYPTPADVHVDTVTIGSVTADLLHSPLTRGDRFLLYLHGGAYVAYSRFSHRELASRIGRACRATVLVPDYRLAPEHPHPAALHDALACYQWLSHRGPVVLAGDSAGGGLALALCQRLRRSGSALPLSLALLSPWTDLTLSGRSIEEVTDDPTLTADRLRRAAADYADGRLDDPEVSPLFADLISIPPTHIEAGTSEILLDDSTRLAEAIRAAGGTVSLHLGLGLPHVYQMLASTPEAIESTTRIATFLDQHLSSDRPRHDSQ